MVAAPTLRFWLSDARPPPQPDHLAFDNGCLVNAFPGYWEIANPAPGMPGAFLVFYVFQLAEQSYSFATCWDGFAFEAVEKWITDSETREQVGAVVRDAWPQFSRLVENGRQGRLDEGALVPVEGAGVTHWCLVTTFSGIDFTRIEQLYEEPVPAAALDRLTNLSLALLKETVEGPLAIPHLVLALGESENARRQKRQEFISTIMDGLGHLKSAFGG